MKLFDTILHGSKARQQQAAQAQQTDMYRSLLHWTAQVGGELFGPIPKGTRREFFCLDQHTWVWHEEWTDKKGKHAVTTRYDVRPNGILKSQGNNTYQALTRDEARNFHNAVTLYYQRVMPELVRLQNLPQ